MPPLPAWYRGRNQVAIFLRGGPLAGTTPGASSPLARTGGLALGLYAWHDKTQTFARAVDVLTLRGAQILAFLARRLPRLRPPRHPP